MSSIYGWKKKTLDENKQWINTPEQIESDLRKFREVFLFIAKKQGKTSMVAGFALHALAADNEIGAQIVSASGDKEQAAIVFNLARRIVEENPRLSQDVKPFKRSMVCYETASNFIVLSSDVKTKHGPNLSTVIVDEVHVQPNRDLIDTLFAGVAARTQPLKIMLTTAGYDKKSICYEYYDYAKKVQQGIIIDDEFLPIIFELDPEDDWKKEENWKKANPNLGKTVSWNFMRSEFKKAIERPTYENTFKRLHLNQWTEQDTRWMAVELWDACNDPLIVEQLRGLSCFGGVDLASKIDITASALIFPVGNKIHVLPHFWMPKENISLRKKRDRVDYDVWVRQGYITATEGNVMDNDAVLNYFDDAQKIYNIQEIGVDPWNAQDLMVKMSQNGLNIVEVPQRFKSQSDATKKTEALILSKLLVHGGNPVLRWMFSNVMIERDSNDNIRPSKKKSSEKIDGIMAIINAISRYLVNENTLGRSIYETQGIMTL